MIHLHCEFLIRHVDFIFPFDFVVHDEIWFYFSAFSNRIKGENRSADRELNSFKCSFDHLDVYKIGFWVVLLSSLFIIYLFLIFFIPERVTLGWTLNLRRGKMQFVRLHYSCIRLFARERGSRSRHVHARVRAYRAYRFFTLDEYTRPRHTGCPHPFAIYTRLIFTLRTVLSAFSKNYELHITIANVILITKITNNNYQNIVEEL